MKSSFCARSILLTSLSFVLFFSIIAVSIVTYQKGGRFEEEHQTTIPHFLSDQPVLPKIFDIMHTEALPSTGNFTARELSYFFDFVDLKLMVASGQLGFIHFLSTVKYLFIVLILIISWIAYRRDFKLDWVFSTLLLLLFLTTPPVFHYVYFHRTAKIGVALCLTGFLLWMYHVFSRPEVKVRVGGWLLCFSVASAAMLFDMQGFFFIMLATALLGAVLLVRLLMMALGTRTPVFKLAIVFSSVLCAWGFHVFYKYFFAFKLIKWLNGYEATASLQTLHWDRIWVKNGWWLALDLMFDYFRHFSGSLPTNYAWYFLGLIILFNTFFVPSDVRWRWFGKEFYLNEIGVAMLAVCVGIVLMNFVSATKVDAIYYPAVRLIVYGLPATVLFLFGFAISIQRLTALYPKTKLLLYAGLASLVIHNTIALPQHKKLLDSQGEGSVAYLEDIIFTLRHRKDPGFVEKKFEYFDTTNKKMATDLAYLTLRNRIFGEPPESPNATLSKRSE